LTTAVMSAVSQSYAGTASGVNNAVTRTAGVLAIAVVGSMAISIFESKLDIESASLHLGEPLYQSLLAEASKLGVAVVPAEIPAENKSVVEQVIRQALAATFQTVMLICAVLAWVSSFMAALLVEKKPKVESSGP